MELKKELKLIAQNDYVISKEVNIDELVNAMLEYIGSLDSELRDDLICSTFYEIIDSDQLSNELLKKIISKITDENHMFYKINENDELAVYTRTFSILIVVCALNRHRRSPIFYPHEIKEVYSNVLNYCRQEKDLRGYVEEYGWAHSVAHSADALNELAMCDEISKEDLLKILDIVKYKITDGTYTYIHKEDERLVTAVLSVIERDLITQKELINWINSYKDIAESDDFMESYRMKLNCRNFLRSMYFRVMKNSNDPFLLDALLMSLDEI